MAAEASSLFGSRVRPHVGTEKLECLVVNDEGD